jgi:hypothetical protein
VREGSSSTDACAAGAPSDDERTIEDAGVGARHAIGRADHGRAAAGAGRADQAMALQGEAIGAEAARARGAPVFVEKFSP